MEYERQIANERVPGGEFLHGELHSDIGTVFQRAKSPNAFAVAVQALSTAEKFSLLKCDTALPLDFVFPITSIGQYNRRFQPKWLLQYSWMMYSISADGAFCKFCAIFCDNRNTKGQFVNEPFRAWNKMKEKAKDHEHTSYHQLSVKMAEGFISTIESPERCVISLVDEARIQNIGRNREILKFIIDAILFCAKQCIALRGDNEHTCNDANPV